MFFKSKEGKAILLKLYNQKLKELNITYTEEIAKTQFGNTNVIVTGDGVLPPLVLIHGTGGCAPLILESFSELSEHYCVYAVDVLAQPNKSDEKRLDMKTLDYGQWILEVIIKLGLSNVTLVGFSFGGLISLKALEFSQIQIKEVFLIAPVYIINGNPLLGLFKMFLPLKKFIKTNNERYIKKVIRSLFTKHDNFALEFMSSTFQHCNMDFSPLPIISKQSAQKISTSITIFAAEKDLMFPGKKMLKRASKIFPSLKGSVLLKDSKHVPNLKDFKVIEDTIINAIR